MKTRRQFLQIGATLAASTGLSAWTYAQDRASPAPGIERAEQFLRAMGGRAAWKDVAAVIVRATHYETSQPGPYANAIWNDFDRPRVRIEAQSATLRAQRAIDGDNGWRWREGKTHPLTPKQVHDEQRWWEANIYRTLHRLARNDPALEARAVGEARLEFFRPDGARLNWLDLNPSGEPVRFGSWDSENGSIFGPLGSADEIKFPRWGCNPTGTWRYEIVEFTPLDRFATNVSFAPPS